MNKRLLLLIISLIFIAKLNLAEVNTRLNFVGNTHNFPANGTGTLILNVEAISTTGSVQINIFENAFQIDANFIDQIQNVSFANQHFAEGVFQYSYTEVYSQGNGRVRYTYERTDLNLFPTTITNAWTVIVSVTIQYTMTNTSSGISWYNGNPEFLVLNQIDQQIQGNEEQIPDELTNIALPVELSSFSARLIEEIVELKWRTEIEVDNYGFEVERKVGSWESEVGSGLNPQSVIRNPKWEKIGFVDGHGNSNSPKNYSFTDKNPVGSSKFVYRLKQIDNDGTFTYSNEVEVEVIPNSYELFQNYPNPFNPSTNIKFSLPRSSEVKIDIYNAIGQLVQSLTKRVFEAGNHSISFDAASLSSGTYIYKIQVDKFSQAKKMLLLR